MVAFKTNSSAEYYRPIRSLISLLTQSNFLFANNMVYIPIIHIRLLKFKIIVNFYDKPKNLKQ